MDKHTISVLKDNQENIEKSIGKIDSIIQSYKKAKKYEKK